MTRGVLAGVLGAAVAVAASSVLMAGQSAQVPNVPGMPTQARTVVVNGAHEAVPVVLAAGGQTQPITVIGTPAVTLAADSVVITRAGRQGWEYRTVAVPAGQDPAGALVAAGVEGWEAVGVTAGAAGASQVLLKRPR